MQIGSIQLLEFRNYRTLEYTPSSRLNLLIGSNAQGKTNLLEAMGFLLTGRSFRTARMKAQTRHHTLDVGIDGEVHTLAAPLTIMIVPQSLLVRVRRGALSS